MAYGITPAGFVKKRLEESFSEIAKEFTAIYGVINESADSRIGQLIGVLAKREADFWDKLEEVYLSKYPRSASGVSLDRAVQYNAIKRLESTYSIVIGILIGVESSIIPSGIRVKVKNTEYVFESQANITLSSLTANYATIQIGTISSETVYSITINGTTRQYESSNAATESEILAGLSAVITTSLNVLCNNDTTNNQLIIKSLDYITPFSISTSAELNIATIGVNCEFKALEKGAIAVPISSLTEILTPWSGLKETNNFLVGNTGRNIESDTSLRLRRERSTSTANSSLEAIRIRIENDVPNVTNVAVYENTSDSIDLQSRPPHSIEVVVSNGTDADIANKLWSIKPGGIATFGNASYEITDSQGLKHLIKFSRPVLKYIHLRVTVQYYNEEDFPNNGEDLIITNLLEYSATFKIGINVIPQRFYGPVYNVPGILNILVEVAATDTIDGTPIFNTNIIDIGPSEIATFDKNLITVVLP